MEDEYTDREQSGIKHFALRKYLGPATRIIGSGWRGFTYVDCCAGPWESQSADFSDTSFGIAVAILKEAEQSLRDRGRNAKFKALLIEEKSSSYKLLAEFARSATNDRVSVEARNWDFREHTDEIRRFVANPKSFGFTFIDPTGWTLAEIAGLEPLLRIEPGEVLINLMTSFIARFISNEATKLEEVLGPGYRDIRTLSHEEKEDEAVRRYCDLIKRQGRFPYVCALPVMKHDQDAIHFYLIFATRNLKGVEVFKEVEKRTERETEVVQANKQQRARPNLDLFTPDVLFKRQERYQRLSERSKVNARRALDALLDNKAIIDYEECWAEAMQFPAVYEQDLGDWLGAYERSGIIQVNGRAKPGEVLKRKSGHTITKVRP